MSKASHQIFRRIVLHNKLLSEAEVDALLDECDDPEAAIAELVQRHVLNEKSAEQFLGVYRKQLDKLFADELDQFDEPPPANEPLPETSDEASAEDERATVPSESAPQPAVAQVEVAADEPLPESEIDLVHALLRAARQVSASDLHLRAGMRPLVRLNGRLQELPYPPIRPDVCNDALLSILEPEQRESFQASHDFDFCYDGGESLGRFRTNLLHEHRGTDAIFRLISSEVPSFEQLGLPAQVRKFTEYRVGVVLVTGPKGCGKTTTLAAMIDVINSSRAEHIITVEDPIEFVHPCKKGHVNQRQVGVHTASFSNALRAALREAPDVIMVGEMRDLETTSLAITAAETGHLVLATLHTPDAIRTIGRVLDVFPPKEQPQVRAMLSESLRGICSQLLLPTTSGDSMVLAVEVLVNTPAIGHLIREEKVHQIRGLMQTGKQHGMMLMDESLARLAKDGQIAREVALAHADDAKWMQRELAQVD